MTGGQLDWRALQEEALRPIPKARRIEWEVCWREWPDGSYRKKGLTALTRDELDELARRVMVELARHAEGPLTVARLLARFERSDRARLCQRCLQPIADAVRTVMGLDLGVKADRDG
jgi:hypothetical protein